MNDLERDLRTVLDHDASRAPLVTAPPDRLRKRVRRRRVRTTLAGGTALIVVSAAIVGGAGWLGLTDRGTVPAENRGSMIFTAGGFTIDVPQELTAVDTTFLLQVMAFEEETCTVSGSVVAPGSDGEPEERSEESCTTRPVEYPAGLPILQLMPSEPSDLDETVCGRLGDGRSATGNAFENDDVGFYLAMLTDRSPSPAWPVPLEPGTGPCGEGVYARFSASGASYLAFAGFGPDVSTTRRQALLDAIAALDPPDSSLQVPPEPALPIRGPGVLIASGEAEGHRWQVTAGLELDRNARSRPVVWADLIGDDGSITDTLTQPWTGDEPVASSMGVGEQQIVIALLPDGTDAPAWENDDGSRTSLATAAAPALMGVTQSARSAFTGRVGWVVAPGQTGMLTTEPVVGANAEPSYDPAPGSRPIEAASGSNDWYSWRVSVQPQEDDTWWVITSVAEHEAPRHEHVAWSGSVPAGTRATDGRSLNVLAIDMTDRVPGGSVLVLAFAPAEAEHIEVSFPGAGAVRTSRTEAVQGTFVALPELDPNVVMFTNSYEGAGIASPIRVEALDAALEPLLSADVDPSD